MNSHLFFPWLQSVCSGLPVHIFLKHELTYSVIGFPLSSVLVSSSRTCHLKCVVNLHTLPTLMAAPLFLHKLNNLYYRSMAS